MWQIGINALLLSSDPGYRSAGVSGYTWKLLRALARTDDRHRYVVFHPPLGAAGLPAFRRPGLLRAVPLPAHPAARIAWEQAALPLAVHGCQLLHAPVNVLPWNLPCPGIVTIHDLAFLRRPDVVAPARRRYLAAATKNSARRAALVLTVSETTRQDVLDLFGVAPERVRVVAPPVDAQFTPGDGPADPPYLLFLGTLEPRKNLETLLDAFALARARGMRGVRLTLAGARDWEGGAYATTIRERIRELGLAEDVDLLGYVGEGERVRLMRGARALVLPSWYEGFGLPAAEALCCGTPVLGANAASLPDVIGDGGDLLAPDDVAGWAGALARAAEDDAWRATRGAAGLAGAWRFNEDTFARGIVAAYDSALLGTQAYAQKGSEDRGATRVPATPGVGD